MIQYSGQVQNLTEVTPPAIEPVTLAQAKLHLRVDFSDDDTLISTLITAARLRVEADTHRSLITREYLLQLDGFPYSHSPSVSQIYPSERLPNVSFGRIKIPKPPLLSVNSIQYVDTTGTLQTLDPSKYQVVSGGKLQGLVVPAYGLVWPAYRYQPNSVQIDYQAGYGPAAANVPATAIQAILVLIGAWYDNRSAISSDGIGRGPVPMCYDALISTLNWGSYG